MNLKAFPERGICAVPFFYTPRPSRRCLCNIGSKVPCRLVDDHQGHWERMLYADALQYVQGSLYFMFSGPAHGDIKVVKEGQIAIARLIRVVTGSV